MKLTTTLRRPRRYEIQEDLMAVEKTIKMELPQELKDFILKAAGKCPEPSCFPVSNLPTDETYADCSGFYGGGNESIAEYIKEYRGLLPKKHIPIGSDECDEQIVYSLEEDSKGYIYYWREEDAEDEKDWKKRSNCYLCATSLQEFLNSFFEDPALNEEDSDQDEKEKRSPVNVTMSQELSNDLDRGILEKRLKEKMKVQSCEEALAFLRAHQPTHATDKGLTYTEPLSEKERLFHQWNCALDYLLEDPCVEAIPLLLNSIGDLQEHYLRISQYLELYPDSEVAPCLLQALRSDSATIRTFAADFAHDVDEMGSDLLEALVAAIGDPDDNVRAYAVHALLIKAQRGLVDLHP